MVDLHQLAGALGALAVPPAPRPGVGEVAAALRPRPAAAERAGPHAAEPRALGEDAPDRRGAQRPALAGEQDADRQAAHEGVPPARAPDRLLVLARPPRRARVARRPRLRRQAAQAVLAVARLPAEVRRPRPADRPQRGGLRAALGAQLAVGLQPAQPFERLGRGRLVHREAAVGFDAHGLDVHGSGSLVVATARLPRTRAPGTPGARRNRPGPPANRVRRTLRGLPRQAAGAAPPLRSGPSGDPAGPAAKRRAMTVSKLPVIADPAVSHVSGSRHQRFPSFSAPGAGGSPMGDQLPSVHFSIRWSARSMSSDWLPGRGVRDHVPLGRSRCPEAPCCALRSPVNTASWERQCGVTRSACRCAVDRSTPA